MQPNSPYERDKSSRADFRRIEVYEATTADEIHGINAEKKYAKKRYWTETILLILFLVGVIVLVMIFGAHH